MRKGRRCGAALLILAVTLLAACSRSIPPTALPADEASSTKPSTPSIPGSFTPASSCPSSGSVIVSLATPQPTDVLLELAWEGGLTRPELAFVFGRIPEFSLLPDGNAYYLDAPEGDEAQMMVAHLTPAERQELVQRVLDLGIESLESYTDACQLQADGSCLCVADAGESLVRVRLPGGDLREIRNYYTFANEPEVLEAIRALLQDYRHPQAEAYQPDKATFFIQLMSPTSDVPVRDWPLHPDWLTSEGPDYPCARTLSGSDLQSLLAVMGRNMGDMYFRDADADQVYNVYLVPWLPGVDYTHLMVSSGQACPPAKALTPDATVTSAALPTRTSALDPSAPGRTAFAQEVSSGVDSIELTGPLLVDSQAGHLYASGRVGEEPKTFVLAATDGRLLATYDVTGTLGLDSVHGWLYVDRDDQGLAVLDAQTGTLQATIPLPDREVVDKAYARPGLAPQADPAAGQVLAFRDNLVYVADPEKGLVTRTIPFDIPKAEDCRTLSSPLPIEWATYDSARRILYLDFETYVCTPWIGHTLVSYDITSGSEIAQQGVSPPFSATAFDGYLYGSSWYRMGDGFRWAWRDGRPWFESSDWSYGAPGLKVDPKRQRLYGLDAGGLHVFDARTMALIMIAPLPVAGQLVGYDPKTDQLYFLVNGGLRPWPASAIQPPTPQPLSVSQPPRASVRSLVVSPTWIQDKTLFGIWDAEDPLGTCWVFGKFGGPLYVSNDQAATWSRSRGGLPDGCDNISALAVSPDYARDRTLLAGVIGLGIFRSTDGGQLWKPSSTGLLSMGIEQILLSPGFARDGTAFASVAPAGGQRGVYRSGDWGHSWQALDTNLGPVAMSPEFDQDHTLMGIAYSSVGPGSGGELHISRDGGDHWKRVGTAPAGKSVYWLSLAPLFEKWNVLFVLASDNTLYRSADGGKSWDAVLNIAYPIFVDPVVVPWQLVYAPHIEVNRPVFLLVRIRRDITDPLSERVVLYRSGDGGLTWQEVELPEDVSPTALAVSPNFAQDGLLFVGTADGRVLTFEDWIWVAAGR